VHKDELSREVAKLDWMHTIDLGQGIVTPGEWPSNQNIIKALDGLDLTGKKVLDLGTCNGIWSFEAEKRGAAEVHAVDYLTHRGYWCKPAFDLAHRALDSKAIYNPDMNVYDVADLGVDDFDVVLFCGLYYHLKYPLLALMRLREVMKTGAKIIVEGPVYANNDRAYAMFHYDDAEEKDLSNWWTPSRHCLREWVTSQFFDITDEFECPDPAPGLGGGVKRAVKRALGRDVDPVKRIVMVAEAVTRKDKLYSSVDEEIINFLK